MNLILKCGQRYTEMQQPPNFLFVRCVMVKIPRTGRQCLDTADPQRHITSRCSTSSQHQSSCSLACLQSALTPMLHCIHLSTPFPCKRNLSKDTFLLDTTTMLQREMEGHQLSVSSRGVKSKKTNKKGAKKQRKNPTQFNIKHGT